jgi:hypothetical protein
MQTKITIGRVAASLVILTAPLLLSGCSYMPYWSGHDMGASVGPGFKDGMDSYSTCLEWSYGDGYPEDPDYIQGCEDAWNGE